MTDASADYEPYLPGDYSEMREGLAPPRLRAGEKAPGVVITLADIAESMNARLADKPMQIKVVVADEYGNDIIVQPVPVTARWGDTVEISVKLALEVT